MAKYKLEYIWLDGYQPTARGRTRDSTMRKRPGDPGAQPNSWANFTRGANFRQML
jgi:hypothetical protein